MKFSFDDHFDAILMFYLCHDDQLNAIGLNFDCFCYFEGRASELPQSG